MKLNRTASGVLNDALFYLDRITPGQYKESLTVLSNATIGQHTRHFIEFYQCLIRQVKKPGKVINYAARARDKRIETDPLFAQTCIREIQSALDSLEDHGTYELECSEHVSDSDQHKVPTTLDRELMYNIEHTIHHLAIIKIGLLSINSSFKVPDHFGVAPSTMIHRNVNVCAP